MATGTKTLTYTTEGGSPSVLEAVTYTPNDGNLSVTTQLPLTIPSGGATVDFNFDETGETGNKTYQVTFIFTDTRSNFAGTVNVTDTSVALTPSENILDMFGDGSMLLCHTFDDTPVDLSGNYTLNPTYVAYGVGKWGSCLDVPNSNAGKGDSNGFIMPVSPTDGYTYSATFKTSNTGYQWVMSDDSSVNTTISARITFGFQPNGEISFSIGDGTNSWQPTVALDSTPYIDGAFHTAVAIIDGTNAKLYIDKTLIFDEATGINPASSAGVNELYIGALGNRGFNFVGLIDQVRFRNKASTYDEMIKITDEMV